MNEVKNNTSNAKKSFYKKWWFYLIVAIVLIAAISGSNEPTTEPIEKQEKSQTTEIDEKTSFVQNDKNEDKINSDTKTEMLQLAPDGYTGPECWLLSGKGITKDGETLDVYAVVDNKSSNWHNECKTVFKMLISEYGEYSNLTFKIYNSKDNVSNNQPTYDSLIALWQSNPVTYVSESKPTITWYPNGAGANSKQESEIWNP